MIITIAAQCRMRRGGVNWADIGTGNAGAQFYLPLPLTARVIYTHTLWRGRREPVLPATAQLRTRAAQNSTPSCRLVEF
jgi:hypothetical protein